MKPAFGQISPLKRPFGAVGSQGSFKELVATPCAQASVRRGNRNRLQPCRPARFISSQSSLSRTQACIVRYGLVCSEQLVPSRQQGLPIDRKSPVLFSPRVRPTQPSIRGAAENRSLRPVPACGGVQVLAGVCPAGSGAAMDVTRTNAVTPMATAPIAEKMACQVSEGMRCFTIPWVA